MAPQAWSSLAGIFLKIQTSPQSLEHTDPGFFLVASLLYSQRVA